MFSSLPSGLLKYFEACINSLSYFQINDLNQVPVPVMLLPDDFKANTKIKVNNHLFNKYDAKISTYRSRTG